jgi:hypothetical protein
MPSADDLRLLSEHLFYEVAMTFHLAGFLAATAGTVLDQLARNAQIEALTIHVRQLHDFLWRDRAADSGHDAFAADYYVPGEWAKLRPDRPAILDSPLLRKVGWGVAHLTYGRARSTVEDKQWDVIGMARALAPAVVSFADNVDPAKLDPRYLDAIRPLAEQFL